MTEMGGSSSSEEEDDYPAKRGRYDWHDCSSCFFDSSSFDISSSEGDDIPDAGGTIKRSLDDDCQENAEAPPKLTRSNSELKLDADLRSAISTQQLELIKSLILQGASVNTVDEQGETPLTLIGKQRPNTLSRKLTHKNIIDVLLENGASVNQKNAKGQTPLHLANSAEVVELLVKNGAAVDEISSIAGTPLIFACKRFRRSVDVITALLEAGACVNGVTNEGSVGTPPLHFASYTAAMLLLEKGANVDQVDRCGESALFVHCRKPNGRDLINALLERGASINLKDRNGLTPLHVVCRRDLSSTAELLLQKGASVNEPDNEGETPLFFAVRRIRGTSDVINLLLRHGALINWTNSKGMTPLHVSRYSAMSLLLNGAAVNATDMNNDTPLILACQRASPDNCFITALLQHGANVNMKNVCGKTALHVACSNLHMDTTYLLLQHGASVNEIDNSCESPLFLSVKRLNCPPELVCRLLDAGAEINLKNDKGQTPLHIACSKGLNNIVELLVQKGASVNEQDNEKASPLLIALNRSTRAVELINALLDGGASVNAQTNLGVTPLHILCRRSQFTSKSDWEQSLSLVNRLLQMGAIVNGIDSNDQTPLEIACSVKPRDTALIRCLLENGATVNRMNAQNQTPLHVACRLSHLLSQGSVTLELLQHGASVSTVDSQGRTPLEQAGDASCPFLLHYGASHCQASCYFAANDQDCRFRKHHLAIRTFIANHNQLDLYENLNKNIGLTNVTYNDLLRLNVPRSDFEEILSTVTPQHLEEVYPHNQLCLNMIYCSYLKIKRLQQMDDCSCLFNFSSLPSLPQEIVYEIFSYLDLGDLTALLQIVKAIQKR